VFNLLQMHPNAVSRLKKRYIEFGIDVLIPEKPGPKNGDHVHNKTPRIVSDIIVELAKNNPSLSLNLISEELQDRYGISIN